MLSSIIAGFLIGMGGIINLLIGDIPGALFFSLGLITIVTFKYNLFTGKAGLLSSGKIDSAMLAKIWIGNFIGTAICAIIASLLPEAEKITAAATKIIETRTSQNAVTNVASGLFCGVLMYIAVTGFEKTNKYLFCIIPVAFFILCGFNHCVADMFYVNCIHITSWEHWSHLISTTIGNLIGTNLLPTLSLYYHREV